MGFIRSPMAFSHGPGWHNWWLSTSLPQLRPQEKSFIHTHLLIEGPDVLTRSRDHPQVFRREIFGTLKPSKLHAKWCKHVETHHPNFPTCSNPSCRLGKDSPPMNGQEVPRITFLSKTHETGNPWFFLSLSSPYIRKGNCTWLGRIKSYFDAIIHVCIFLRCFPSYRST